MPRPRTPAAKAAIEGRHIVHPERYKSRREPHSPPLGNAPSWLGEDASVAFKQLRTEVPWLLAAHTCHTVIAATLLAKLYAGAASIPEMNLLRLCLGQMGATPVDASKVSMPPADDEPDSLLD